MNPLVYVPLVTPLSDADEVCTSSVERLVDYRRDIVSGYIGCLTSGEGWRLSDGQWSAMIKALRNAAPDHVVIAGIERSTTDEVLELAATAESLGAQGIMITTPFGESVSQRKMVDHYQKVHNSTALDVYIYNETDLSKNITDPETLVEISKLRRVVGIKESGSSDDFVGISGLLKASGLKIFQGWEDRLTQSEFAHGSICSLNNINPEICMEAMKRPSKAIEKEVSVLCEEYNLFADDWYRYIKEMLVEMNIISTSRLAKEPNS